MASRAWLHEQLAEFWKLAITVSGSREDYQRSLTATQQYYDLMKEFRPQLYGKLFQEETQAPKP